MSCCVRWAPHAGQSLRKLAMTCGNASIPRSRRRSRKAEVESGGSRRSHPLSYRASWRAAEADVLIHAMEPIAGRPYESGKVRWRLSHRLLRWIGHPWARILPATPAFFIAAASQKYYPSKAPE
eukprot:4731856-Pyramimonas_sp.AAC.1